MRMLIRRPPLRMRSLLPKKIRRRKQRRAMPEKVEQLRKKEKKQVRKNPSWELV